MKQMRIPIALAICAMLVACGGGSGGGSGSDPEQNDSQQPNADLPSGSGLNGGLTGRIITSYNDILIDRYTPVQYDLFTGQVSELPMDVIQDELLRNGQSNNEFLATEESFFGAISTSSTRYLQTVPDCIRTSSEYHKYDSCLATYGDDLQRQTQFRIPDFQLTRPAKLSPSGRFIAIHELDTSITRTQARSFFALYDVAGLTQVDLFAVDITSRERNLTARESPIAWTPDEALVYTVPSDEGVVVYITEPGSLDVARAIRFPEIFQGSATSLDVSPDGTKVLLGYEPGPSSVAETSGILLLDFETLAVTVPAVSEQDPAITPLGDNILGNVRAPIWSPDGQWILVLEGRGIIADSNAGSIASFENLFAVPADKQRTLLSRDTPTEAISITLEHPSRPGSFDDTWRGGNRYDASFDWID